MPKEEVKEQIKSHRDSSGSDSDSGSSSSSGSETDEEAVRRLQPFVTTDELFKRALDYRKYHLDDRFKWYSSSVATKATRPAKGMQLTLIKTFRDPNAFVSLGFLVCSVRPATGTAYMRVALGVSFSFSSMGTRTTMWFEDLWD